MVGIQDSNYWVGESTRTVANLQSDGNIEMSAEQLSKLGFLNCQIANGSLAEYQKASINKLISRSNLGLNSIKYFITSNAITKTKQPKSILSYFEYDTAKLQNIIGLNNAISFNLSESGCASLFQSIYLSSLLLESSHEANYALCSAGDILPNEHQRDILHSLISDGGCNILLTNKSPKYKIIGYTQTTKASFFDAHESRDQLLSTYLPTAINTINSALEQTQLAPKDIDHVIPHNVSLKSWEILAELTELPIDRVYTANIPKFGHTTQADFVINLKSMEYEHTIRAGDKLLCFTFGFGAHWAVLILEAQ